MTQATAAGGYKYSHVQSNLKWQYTHAYKPQESMYASATIQFKVTWPTSQAATGII